MSSVQTLDNEDSKDTPVSLQSSFRTGRLQTPSGCRSVHSSFPVVPTVVLRYRVRLGLRTSPSSSYLIKPNNFRLKISNPLVP